MTPRLVRALPWLSGVAVAAWIAVLFHGVLLGGEVLARRDLAAFHRPMQREMLRLWRDSEGLPAWSDRLAFGQPFAANPNGGALYPLAALFAVLPFDAAANAQVIVPVVGTLLAMLLLLHSLGLGRAAALLGACAWALGGALLSLSCLLPSLLSLAPAPAVAAFAARLARHGRGRDVVGLALTFALAVAGGGATMVVVTVLASVAAALHVRLASSAARLPAGRRAAALGVAGWALGLAAAAAIVLPAVSLAARSVRSQPLPEQHARQWSMRAERLLEPVFPAVLGTHTADGGATWWRPRSFGAKPGPLLESLYVGLIPAALTLAALLAWRRELLPWLLAGGAGTALALGDNTPWGDILRELLPPLVRLRYPEKWAMLTILALVVLAAWAADRLFSADDRMRRRSCGVLLALALLLAAAAVVTRLPSAPERLGVDPGRVAAFAAHAPLRSAAGALLALLAMAAVAALARRRATGLVAVLLALTAADLLPVTLPLLATRPATEVDRPPGVLAPLAARPSPPLLVDLASRRPGCGALELGRIPLGLGIPTALGSDYDASSLLATRRLTGAFFDLITTHPGLVSPLLTRFGVGAVLLCEPAPPRPPAVVLQLRDADQGPEHCVDAALGYAGVEGWKRAVTRLGRAVPRTALIESDSAGTPPERFSPCRVRSVVRRPDHLVLEVDARGPERSLLDVARSWDAGWSATIDGEAAPLLLTDIALSSLVVPPGLHRVELRYHDAFLTLGVVISLLTLAAIGLALLLRAVAVRRRGA